MPATIPTKLGRYDIIERLGHGAMGVVYLARDPIIGRRVALKTLQVGLEKGDPDSEEFRHRFIREAQSAGILSHPHIVTIHDVVEESEEGVTFIAMEYIEGTDLKQIIRSGQTLSLDAISDIATQMADALDYAHSKGVIHRDIKPANIIIDSDGQVKITDFGIARLDASDLTQDGQLLGTPNYMAPERIVGQQVDHRSDIFSLGVLLYELITGHKPFEGDGVTMVTHHIVHGPFTSPREYVPDLPAGVTEVFEKALAKNPDDRYQIAGELAADFRLEVAGFDVPAMETSGLDELSLGTSEAVAAESPATGAPGGETEDEPEAETQDVSEELERQRREIVGGGVVEAVLERVRGLPKEVQIGAAVGAALLLLLLSGGVVWLVAGESEAVEASSDVSIEERLEPHLVAARLALEQGEPEEALDDLERARQVDPDDPRVATLTEDARRMVRQQRRIRDETFRMAELIRMAEADLEEGRYEAAIAAADEALRIDSANVEATRILEMAREEQRRVEEAEAEAERRRLAEEERRRQAAERRARAAAAPEVPGPEPESTAEIAETEEEAPPPVEPPTYTLDIDFYTEISDGVLTIYAGQEQILREEFSFYEKTGFLRREPRAGRINASRRLPKGDTSLKVYVSVEGVPTRVERIDATLPGGATHVLEIRMDESGSLSADLK